MLITLCNLFLNSHDILVIRDLTMILLSYAGFLRFDEVSNLKCRDITFFDDYLKTFISHSKTDQFRHDNEILIAKGNSVACPCSKFVDKSL